jgi:hypothetical protein
MGYRVFRAFMGEYRTSNIGKYLEYDPADRSIGLGTVFCEAIPGFRTNTPCDVEYLCYFVHV